MNIAINNVYQKSHYFVIRVINIFALILIRLRVYAVLAHLPYRNRTLGN